MKKSLIALALVAASFVSVAGTKVGLEAIHDNVSHQNGARVVVAQDIGQPFALTGSAAIVYGQYQRYTLGAEMPVASFGPVNVSVLGNVGMQDAYADNRFGYGINVGAKASYKVMKNLDATFTFERWTGQEQISARDGNMTSLGLSYSF